LADDSLRCSDGTSRVVWVTAGTSDIDGVVADAEFRLSAVGRRSSFRFPVVDFGAASVGAWAELGGGSVDAGGKGFGGVGKAAGGERALNLMCSNMF
jgi:hypothetical protein